MLTTLVRTTIRRSFHKSLFCGATVDPTQDAAMNEECFLLDLNDKVIGRASKRECHTVKGEEIPLHRAFSVFLFNKHGHLVLQKRASEKITYPDCYTNSCCSHPIGNVAGEEEESDALGVKRAAVRRLNYELGIPINQMPIEKLHYVTRIYYKDCGNGKWGEHEIDYVLFMQGDMTIKPNPNEVSEISYIPRADIDSFIPTLNSSLTPWFSLILKHRLKLWWDNLNNLQEVTDHTNILKLTEHSCSPMK